VRESAPDSLKQLDLSHLLFPSARLNASAGMFKTKNQDHQLHLSLDNLIVKQSEAVLEGLFLFSSFFCVSLS
jgi:hypothetical protein